MSTLEERRDWKEKMLEIGQSRLSELRGLIQVQKKGLALLEKEYTDLWTTLKGLGWKPPIMEEVRKAEATSDSTIFRWEIVGETGAPIAWTLRQDTVDKILSAEVPSPFHSREVQRIASMEPGRSQNQAALAQAARGYLSYLLRQGKITRGHKHGWYVKVGNHTPPAPKPEPKEKQGPAAYEHDYDLFINQGVVTTEKPEPRGYGQ